MPIALCKNVHMLAPTQAARKKANKRAREQGFKELGAEALAAAEAVQHTFAGFEEHTTGAKASGPVLCSPLLHLCYS